MYTCKPLFCEQSRTGSPEVSKCNIDFKYMYSFIDVTVSHQYMPHTNILYITIFYAARKRNKPRYAGIWYIVVWDSNISVAFVLMSQQKRFQNNYFLTLTLWIGSAYVRSMNFEWWHLHTKNQMYKTLLHLMVKRNM